ncbi:hypothetical protein SAMN06297251_11480 [Fulvimarina manganoxydans]|uniref:Uncharacterized protein n=1 Tax=Fulvimarina manganoxydans TaxID=937218 RepID=A0A1W2DFY1_9HYPH|nr:hypothetical protein [Fulvimarina manganoxydans]SMC95838.1 hypothetical protein SAMN06297251_11480 [Fulvimarina manganoxydans]
MFDKARLIEALERLGNDLLARGLFIELAVYRGSAIVLQFDWGRSTEYVDAVVREGYDEHALGASVAVVARQMGLEGDWLNNAVGMYTPLGENDDLFDVMGNYPMTGTPGLRVLTAKPQYLLAMKLQALRNIDRGDKDLGDARRWLLISPSTTRANFEPYTSRFMTKSPIGRPYRVFAPFS